MRYSRPTVDQEAEPLADLLQDARGDLALLFSQLLVEVGETRCRRLLDGELRHLADRCRAAIFTASALRLQTMAVAGARRAR
ncbi:MAG: hypothetical protein MPW15_01520 [Candidatus Manganitrophus sp.]|nr:hypothetical protein [Candidatus Manganitrophus sp.]